MGQRFQPRQPQKTAGAFNRVNQPKNIIQDLGVVRLLLKPNQLIVDRVQALAGLGQKLAQKIIHQHRLPGCSGRLAAVAAAKPVVVGPALKPRQRLRSDNRRRMTGLSNG